MIFRFYLIFFVLLPFALQAAELPKQFPDLPLKDEIQAELLESDVFTSSKLPRVLAPLVAEYADNTVHGHIAIAGVVPLKFNEIIEKQQKDYREQYPDFARLLEEDDVLIPGTLCAPTHYFNFAEIFSNPLRDGKELNFPPGIAFPDYFPAKLLVNKAEGDIIQFRYAGLNFILRCNQAALAAHWSHIKHARFEDALHYLMENS